MSPRRRRQALRRLGVHLGPGLLLALGGLSRVRVLHPEREEEVLSDHQSVIYAFWHGRLFLLAARLRDRRAGVLISLSEDGDLMARAAERLGFHPVRGSSSRGGREGLRDLEAVLAGGRSVGLTPDGPRGPRHRAQMGAVALAARSGKPILPLSSASRSAWRLRSWDRFQIPRPGTRAVIAFGEPLRVPPEPDLEPWRARLERALIDLEHEADAAVGRSPAPEPASAGEA